MKMQDQLVQQLDQLRRKLNLLRERLENSGVHRTAHMKRWGDDCKLYQRSLNLFESEDYEELRGMITELGKCFDIVEGR